MNCAYVNKLIVDQKDSLASNRRRGRFLILGGGAILLFAIAIWLLAFLKRIDANIVGPVASLAGAFISFCSVLQLKDIAPGKIKLTRWEALKRECERMKHLPEDEQAERLIKLNKKLLELE